MRNLFRRSSFLFWQYPTLWLPVDIADLAAFCLTQLQTRLTHFMVARLVAGHSVLGNTPDPVDGGLSVIKVALLTRPMVWGDHLLSLCLYTAAMIAISTLVPQLIAEGSSSPKRVLSILQKSGSSLVIFAFKILILIGIAAIPLAIFAGLISHGSLRVPFYGAVIVPIYYAGYAIGLLLSAAIGYLIAPSAITLLRHRGAGPISREAVRLARIAAVLTQFASGTLYLLAAHIGHSFISPTTPIGATYAVEAAESVVSAVPYIVLFIALSLLASTDNAMTAFTVEPTWDAPPAPNT
jgi:hypothetical protein